MQGDKKIGLALGILLIGIVAAFFFRNEPAVTEDVPQLEDAKSLDARIEEQRLTPYPSSANESPPANSEWTIPDFLAGEDNPRRGTPPQPIPFSTNNDNPSKTPVFQPDPSVNAPIVGNYRMYTVQPGDTLSGISTKFLGRSSRYHEIYEANKDQMRSADDLRVGITLRIPIDGTSSQNPGLTKSTPGIPPTPSNPQFDGFSAPNPRSQPSPKGNPVPEWNTNEPFRSDPVKPTNPAPRATPLPERSNPQTYTPPIASKPVIPASNPQVTPPASPQPKPQTSSRLYQVQPGDTLERVAIQIYGDRRAVRKIYEANRDKITSPHRLPEGMMIILP